MKLTKRITSLLLALVCIIALFPVTPAQAAVPTLPSSLYLTQMQSGTCTLCSAAMMLRSRLYRDGDSNWSTVTETALRPTAWVEGTGLRWKFTYSGLTVDHANTSGISVAKLKSILDDHPEGIVLYCGNLPHALFLIGYSGDTFYCAETVNGYSGKTITLAQSYLGSKYGNQANVLNNVTAYWYVRSAADNECNCSADYAGTYLCITSTSSLTIRSGHSTAYQSVGMIPPGAKVTVTKASGTASTDWAHVQYNGISGYASMQYLLRVEDKKLHVSESSVDLSLTGTKSKTVYVRTTGERDEPTTLTWSRSNSNVTCDWGQWSDGKLPLKITAKAAGTTRITVSELDAAGEVLETAVIDVTVSDKSYTVTYDANGGSGAPGSQTKQHGSVLPLSEAVPFRFGYTFLGWTTAANGTAAEYLPGDDFLPNADTTLYAVWDTAPAVPGDITGKKLYAPISFRDGYKYYSFTPKKTGEYTFESTGSLDPVIYLYDASGNRLSSDDDSGSDSNFRLVKELTGGKKYYFKITLGSGSSRTGTVSLSLKRNVPVIVAQSSGTAVAAGQTANVLFTATGKNLTYQWYYAEAGSSAFKKTGTFTTNRYYTAMTAAKNGRRVYCVVTDQYGDSVRTDTVTLRMKTALSITKQPSSVSADMGKTAKVTVKATGDGLTYQWYYADAGSTVFRSTDTFTTASYYTSMTSARSGRRVYCIISDQYGKCVRTETVTLTMRTPLKITQQPTGVAVPMGEKAKVTVKVTGDGLTYQWYYAEAGGSEFKKTDTFTSNSYFTNMTSARNGRQVYCVITDKYGKSVRTDTVTLRMKTALTISKQPTGVAVAMGEKAKVTVKATGDGLTYQWYYAEAGSSEFKKTDTFTSNSYFTNMTSARNGRRVYCVITDKYGESVRTKTVTLSMT